jgi:hypothetical protein
VNRPSSPDVVGKTAALLDEALQDLLLHEPDPRVKTLRRRQRLAGTTLLILASVCIVAITALSPFSASLAVWRLTLGTSAVVLMFLGAWLIDYAGKQELSERREGFTGKMGESLNEPSQALANRQRYFGISMLALAVFSIFVAVAPLPGKEQFDVLMWSGFSIILLATGAWQIERAAKAARRAQELIAIERRRKTAQSGSHLRRVS